MKNNYFLGYCSGKTHICDQVIFGTNTLQFMWIFLHKNYVFIICVVHTFVCCLQIISFFLVWTPSWASFFKLNLYTFRLIWAVYNPRVKKNVSLWGPYEKVYVEKCDSYAHVHEILICSCSRYSVYKIHLVQLQIPMACWHIYIIRDELFS